MNLDIRKLSAKWIPKCLNAKQKRQPCRSSEQHLEIFFVGAIQMISSRDWWPWTRPGYITMTRRRSNNQWSGVIAAHPAPNIPRASSWWIIFQRAKVSSQLCWCNWRTFWRKSVAGISPRWPYSCTTNPHLTGHLQSRRNWPTWASSILISHPNLRFWPCRTTTCLMDCKKQ